MAATDARVVTCCDPIGIEKQKQMMKDWDPSLLQVQLPYFGPSYSCKYCRDKSPARSIQMAYSYNDLIVAYWISLRGLVKQKDRIIEMFLSKNQSLLHLLNTTMQDVIKLAQSTSKMKSGDDYNPVIVSELSTILNQLGVQCNGQDKIHLVSNDGRILQLILRKNIFAIKR